MEYTVVEEVYLESLISKVNELMKAGWMPLGGIAIDIPQDGLERVDFYCQAMRKD
jgi:hypothetical protein